jgi:hypothetical protein
MHEASSQVIAGSRVKAKSILLAVIASVRGVMPTRYR